MNRIICGVDVSNDWLDAHIRPANINTRFDNDAAGIEALAALCRQHGVELVALEASGGSERMPFLFLWELGIACALVNAQRVRGFARSIGYLEKTDRIDAAVIAQFAEAKRAKATPPPSREQQRLANLVSRLSQVTSDLTVNKQRLSAARDEETRESIRKFIAFLKREIRGLEGEIASLIDDDPLWARLDAAFRSVKGVADRTVARLMAQLPEIGQVSNKAIAKLAGLAPIADDSGKRKGKRSIRGGRAGPRSVLFLVAAIAARHDSHLASFLQRLRAAGKPKMVVRIALARKLLVILNAKARDARREFANAT